MISHGANQNFNKLIKAGQSSDRSNYNIHGGPHAKTSRNSQSSIFEGVSLSHRSHLDNNTLNNSYENNLKNELNEKLE